MKKTLLAILFFGLFSFGFSQNTATYWVELNNKNNSSYSLQNPSAFLSSNALQRRQQQNISLTQTDLPVSTGHLDSIKTFSVKILGTSKWLNGVLLSTSSTSVPNQIEALGFVKSVSHIRAGGKSNVAVNNKLEDEFVQILAKPTTDVYGYGANQIELINGHYLHNLGYTGQNIQIAVMDNGFDGINTIPFYQNAIANGSIIQGYNFVDDTSFVYNKGNHGTLVLSTIKTNEENILIGAAPSSETHLYITEDNNSEGILEEIYWAMAAEHADSVFGNYAIISTSLGYSNGFSYGVQYQHTYADMDGNTTPITIAADIAASKGILVINSAGNAGNNPWRFITAPADGDSVLAVGAITKTGDVVGFSSRGPSADNQVKPEVCAPGAQVVGVNPAGDLVDINGTSFSCPITSGLAACLWQAFPNKTAMQIHNAIKQSAHLYTTPNDSFGHGIPDFYRAFFSLMNDGFSVNADELEVYPNPFTDAINIISQQLNGNTIAVSVYDYSGQLVTQEFLEKDNNFNFDKLEHYQLTFQNTLQKGTYVLQVTDGNNSFLKKIVKQ